MNFYAKEALVKLGTIYQVLSGLSFEPNITYITSRDHDFFKSLIDSCEYNIKNFNKDNNYKVTKYNECLNIIWEFFYSIKKRFLPGYKYVYSDLMNTLSKLDAIWTETFNELMPYAE